MAQNEIVEVSTTSNDRKTNRRVLVASLSIHLIWPCRLIVRNAFGKQLILNWIPSRWQMR